MFEQVTTEEPPSRVRAIVKILPRVGLALFFAFVGYSKFNNDPRGEWVQIFERIGVGQWLRYVTGVMQVGGAILILSRRTLTIGAAMLACTMVGAALVDLFIMTSPIVIVPLLLLMIVTVVWLTA
jgi:putative oxidoreductase